MVIAALAVLRTQYPVAVTQVLCFYAQEQHSAIACISHMVILSWCPSWHVCHNLVPIGTQVR